MAIKCGNCHKSHDTIQQVQQCHEVEKPAARATDKQVAFLISLKERKQFPDLPENLQAISKGDASQLIDKLMKLPDVPKANGNGWTVDFVLRGNVPQDGTYTVVLSTGHRTLRIRKPHPQADWKCVEYMFGPDNEGDFKKIGKVVDGGVALWKQYDTDAAVTNALKFLLDMDNEELKAAGYKYALESGNCYRCGRKLTVPASIHAGMGPVCAGKEAM